MTEILHCKYIFRSCSIVNVYHCKFVSHVLMLMFVVVNFFVHILTKIWSYLFGHVNQPPKFSENFSDPRFFVGRIKPWCLKFWIWQVFRSLCKLKQKLATNIPGVDFINPKRWRFFRGEKMPLLATNIRQHVANLGIFVAHFCCPFLLPILAFLML